MYYIFKKYSILFENYLKKKIEICFLVKLGNIYKINLGNFKDLKLFLWIFGVIRLSWFREVLM